MLKNKHKLSLKSIRPLLRPQRKAFSFWPKRNSSKPAEPSKLRVQLEIVKQRVNNVIYTSKTVVWTLVAVLAASSIIVAIYLFRNENARPTFWKVNAAAMNATASADLLSEELGKNSEIMSIISHAQAEKGFPGGSLAVMKDGELVASFGFGYADVEQRVPCIRHTVYRIASISKALTSAALGILMEEGKINLHAPVQQYLPEYPRVPVQGSKIVPKQIPAAPSTSPQSDSTQQASTPAAAVPERELHTITTAQLASHTSGIRSYKGKEVLSEKRYSTIQDTLKVFMNDELMHEPGKKFLYSSLNYNVLSAVIEAILQQHNSNQGPSNFLDFMNQRVFQPLGMKTTQPEFAEMIVPHRSKTYKRICHGKLLNTPDVDLSFKWAGGGFISSAEDVAKFGNAMLRNKLLKPETTKALWSAVHPAPQYGLGWQVSIPGAVVHTNDMNGLHLMEQSNKIIVSHSGGAVGASSNLLMLPEYNIVVCIIVNQEDVSLHSTALEIANLYKNYKTNVVKRLILKAKN